MKKLILSFAIIAIVVSSCDVVRFDEDINKNPNLPGIAAPTQLITNAMLSLPDLSSSPQGEYNAQYLSQTQYVGGSLYPAGGTSFYWLYQGPLQNLQTAIEKSNEANEIAVAKILKAYYFWHITDRWGDIPYSEALQGIENFTPAYDTQKAIYDSLFASLKEAGSQIETSGSLEGDIIYNGDMEKWRKLSNTVRLLMALRLSEVSPQKARQEFNDALDDGVMTSNDDNFLFQHLADANNENYWYGQIVRGDTREWWAISTRFMQMMKPVNDPRLPVFADRTRSGGNYVGLDFGTLEENITSINDYSLLGDPIHQQDSPVYLVTYAQVLFAKAEAAQRGWITESAATNYNNAIKASIAQWTGSNEGVQDYLAQPEVIFNPANGIEMISNQRYIHLFMHGYEAWAEWRRTGYPDNMVKPQGRNVPLRQSYTSDEALNNTENYEEAVERQFGGENTLYGRLWWDVE